MSWLQEWKAYKPSDFIEEKPTYLKFPKRAARLRSIFGFDPVSVASEHELQKLEDKCQIEINRGENLKCKNCSILYRIILKLIKTIRVLKPAPNTTVVHNDLLNAMIRDMKELVKK